jgi:hypothetical protein
MELKDLVNLDKEGKRRRGDENKKIKETFYNKAAIYYL